MNATEQYLYERDEQTRENHRNPDLEIATKRYTESLVRANYVKAWTWMGVPILQYPSDVMAMQEIIWRVQPDIIIETGVAFGGMTAFYADVLRSVGACFNSRVIGIDKEFRSHTKDALFPYRSLRGLKEYYDGKVSLFESDSTSMKLRKRLCSLTAGKRVLVTLDSNHTHEHVLQELNLYAPLVSVGSYIVTFDTAIEFHGHLDKNQDREWGKGNNPWTATREFLKTDMGKNFIVDKEIENRILITSAIDGWLRRIK